MRAHSAQHTVLRHITFRVGSGLAALYQVGNLADHLHVSGGRYGIMTENTTPYWPFTLVDSTFEGQRDAAIREHTAMLTVIRSTFRDVPVAIEIDEAYSDQIWIQDSRFERVSRAAVLISNERNAHTQVGVQNAVCAGVPVFARWRESSRTQAAPAAIYRVNTFTYGLVVPADGATGRIETRFTAARASPSAAFHRVGQRAHAGRQGRWPDRRHRGVDTRRAIESRPLLPHRPLHRARHHHAGARHACDRAPSRPGSHNSTFPTTHLDTRAWEGRRPSSKPQSAARTLSVRWASLPAT